MQIRYLSILVFFLRFKILHFVGTFGRGGAAFQPGSSSSHLFSVTTQVVVVPPPLADEKLIRAIGDINQEFPRLNVFDTGPFSHSASFFPSCKFQFMSLPGVCYYILSVLRLS